MAIYKVEKNNVKKKQYFTCYEELSTSVLFWGKCKEQSKKDKIKVRYIVKPNKKVDNAKVVNAIVEYPTGEVWYYTLKE